MIRFHFSASSAEFGSGEGMEDLVMAALALMTDEELGTKAVKGRFGVLRSEEEGVCRVRSDIVLFE